MKVQNNHQASDSDAPAAPWHQTTRLARAQALVVSVLNDLLTAPDSKLDSHINQALERLCRFSRCDRTYVFQIRNDLYMDNTHEWCMPGIAPTIDDLQNVPIGLGDPWWHAFRNAGHITIPDVSALPAGDDLREMLESQDIRSLLAVPLIMGQDLAGFVGYDAVRAHRTFDPAEIALIQSVANGIGAVLHRRNTAHEVLHAREAFAVERNRLQAMMAALPDLVLEADCEGVFTGYHQTAPTIMAITPDEVVGKRPEQVFPPHLAELIRRMMRDVDSAGHSGPEEYALDLPHGRRWYSAFVSARMPTPPRTRHGYVFVVRDITHEIDQRRRIEQLGTMARLTSNMVIITDADRRIIWINPACAERTGYAAHEAIGRLPGEILHLDDAPTGHRDGFCTALATGESIRSELQARDRDGRAYALALHARPMVSDIDGTHSLMLVLSDITERKRDEAALAAAATEAEATRLRLENAVNALHDAFVYYDRNRRLVMCNEPYRAIYPRTAPLLVPGARLEDLIVAADRNGELAVPLTDSDPRSHPMFDRFDGAHYETERISADGRWLRVIEKATPDGGRVGMLVDISALKAAEARALRDRATALDASREGIAIVNPDGRFSYANKAMAAMFALPDAAGIIGQAWTSIYPPVVSSSLWKAAMPRLQSDGFWQGEVRVPGNDEGVHDLSITRDGDGSLLCILRDVTQQRQARKEQLQLREELQLAQRREVIAQLATELTHDFNNLLNVISGSAALIRRSVPGTVVDGHATRVMSASDQATGLVRRLMALGARSTNRRQIDLRKPVRDAAALVRATLATDSMLRLELPVEPLKIRADPTDVLQVILNLTINARDAIAHAATTKTNGAELDPTKDPTKDPAADKAKIAVRLRAARPDDLARAFVAGHPDPDTAYVILSVTDQGPGMSDEIRARAFERHFSTKGSGGTGLGLPIVANVVTSNHGCIALDSAPGKGCTVTVLWPVSPPAEDPGAHPRAAPAETTVPAGATAKPLRGRNIVVVDDNDQVLSVMCRYLEQAGAEVVGCISPLDALDAVSALPGHWDLVFSDEHMPGMSGTALSRTLHANAPEVPVIIVSALAQMPAARRELPGNVVARLEKPVTRETLVAAAIAALPNTKPRRAEHASSPG